jgi:hypothetical protein
LQRILANRSAQEKDLGQAEGEEQDRHQLAPMPASFCCQIPCNSKDQNR